ncbi:hypothetical protein AB0H83_19635 [Dactylosporangium sp. NPDC050688]|uniref:hypothetical protein n=1 Tax=Dactylosporangium sp. NPDC050688 TaxID=3157217 RepID=UPI0033DF3D40
MHAPARATAALLAAALAGGALAGCSPPEEPLMAVGRDAGGRPVLHLRLCGDDRTVAKASLMLRGPDPTPDITGGGSATAVAEVPLWRIWNAAGIGTTWAIEIGTTPAGWREEPDPAVPPGPIAYTPAARYRVIALTSPPHIRSVTFTLADLDGLEDGQVRGHRGHGGGETTLTLQQFREQAGDAC